MKLQLVRPRIGRQWVREGLLAYRQAPMVFFSLFMLFISGMTLISWLPFVGGALAAALAPAVSLAMMAASAQCGAVPASVHGIARPPTAGLFIAALRAVRQSLRPLCALGAIYAIVALLITLLINALVGDLPASVRPAGGAVTLDLAATRQMLWYLALSFVLTLPLTMALFHAPALVHWHAVPPVKSLFFSFVACWRNFGAMTVYSLVWIGVALAGLALLGVLGQLVIAVTGTLAFAAGFMYAGIMVLVSMMFASSWFSFRDCFHTD